ncbi:hypothetical protein HHI36_007431 [Cryptolaemus montrouzieri]|uniref:Uncharacterized protein n=1 Tax=Cryptolaemus montrouzieri TaxID=559131 RepID=A0ABD2MPS4_9CUCU
MVKLPVESIDKDLVSIEVWDNNVILQITFDNCDKECLSYMYGVHSDELQEKYIEEPHILNALHEQPHILNAICEEPDQLNIIKPCVDTKPDVTCDSSSENTIKIENSVEDESDQPNNMAASYESSGDELSCSYSPCKSRGILKRHSLMRKSFSRSISESSLDDCIGSLDYESLDSAIPEDNETSGELSTSLKKTVRFNDVVSRQLYRFNSSILGQKKKNQRKAQKKKKALERRHSESEASEIEDRKEGDQETQNQSYLKHIESCEDKSAKRDENIFHLDM